MKTFLQNVRDIAIAGFLALLPLYVMILIIGKMWRHSTLWGQEWLESSPCHLS